ncbi:MAG TPA: HlyD family efflux transporter periplasmic adaptor subunit [Gemmatimonadaceae bacterium]|jgi:membrane fusion protein YbhG|nr:HlyD family efflux transporter periplasmic adaptor subunit [Gemmatimonadaceae bacterium]
MRRMSLAGSLVIVIALASCREAKGPDAYGNIEAIEVVVGSQSAGQLETFTPKEGNVLSAGVAVALVDPTALTLQLEQANAQHTASASRVDEVTRQIGVLEAQRAIAQRAYDRIKRLYDQQAATAQQLDQAERDYRTLVAQIEAAGAQRKTAAHDVATSDTRTAEIRDQLRRAKVINPVTGTVLTTYTHAGEFVQTGQPLYKIANLDTVELRAYVSESQLPGVKLGRPVVVTADAGTGTRRTFPAVVSWVSSRAEFTPTPIETRDQRTNLVYAIKLRVPNPGGVLKIGMPADVELTPVTAAR